MKKNATHYESVHIRVEKCASSEDMAHVFIGTFYHDKPIINFFIPAFSCMEMTAAIKTRAKAMGVTFDHYSSETGPKTHRKWMTLT